MSYYKNGGCWKELDGKIIYYQCDSQTLEHLSFRIDLDKKMEEYFNIVPKNLGVLKKYKSHLILFIKTRRSTLITKLNIISLKMKITYRIYKENYFYSRLIYDFYHNMLLILKFDTLIQYNRNKLIRNYYGGINTYLNAGMVARMSLMQFRFFGNGSQFFINNIQKRFERIFNISIDDINKEYGKYRFKFLGNFIILKQQFKFQDLSLLQKHQQFPVYYLSQDIILKRGGAKGYFYLGKGKSLKLIKWFHTGLYVVIGCLNQYEVYVIRNGELIQICQIHKGNNRKKPILQFQYLIVTNKNDQDNPSFYLIDLQKNK